MKKLSIYYTIKRIIQNTIPPEVPRIPFPDKAVQYRVSIVDFTRRILKTDFRTVGFSRRREFHKENLGTSIESLILSIKRIREVRHSSVAISKSAPSISGPLNLRVSVNISIWQI